MLTTHNVPYALQHINDIFQEKICRPFRLSDSGNLKEESSSCIVCKSEPFSSNREALAWKACTDEIDVGKVIWVDGSCVFKIQFSFWIVDSVICLICILIDFTMTDAFVIADRFQS